MSLDPSDVYLQVVRAKVSVPAALLAPDCFLMNGRRGLAVPSPT